MMRRMRTTIRINEPFSDTYLEENAQVSNRVFRRALIGRKNCINPVERAIRIRHENYSAIRNNSRALKIMERLAAATVISGDRRSWITEGMRQLLFVNDHGRLTAEGQII